MRLKMIALSLGFALLVPLAQRALADDASCAPRADLVAQLHETYRESRRAVALAANNSVVEIFAADTGSWSILVTPPGGQTCLIASGESYETLAERLPMPGTPL